MKGRILYHRDNYNHRHCHLHRRHHQEQQPAKVGNILLPLDATTAGLEDHHLRLEAKIIIIIIIIITINIVLEWKIAIVFI